MQETDDSLLGMFALSRAGHDKGKVYIIIGEAGEYLYVADGQSRTVERPKRKNRKHIQVAKKGTSPELTGKLKESQPVSNEEIKYLIKTTFKFFEEVMYVES